MSKPKEAAKPVEGPFKREKSTVSLAFHPTSTSPHSVINESTRARPTVSPNNDDDNEPINMRLGIRFTGFFQSYFNQMKESYIVVKKKEAEIESLDEECKKLKRQIDKLIVLGPSGQIYLRHGKGNILTRVKASTKKEQLENRLLLDYDKRDTLAEELVDWSRKIDEIHDKMRLGIEKLEKTYIVTSYASDACLYPRAKALEG